MRRHNALAVGCWLAKTTICVSPRPRVPFDNTATKRHMRMSKGPEGVRMHGARSRILVVQCRPLLPGHPSQARHQKVDGLTPRRQRNAMDAKMARYYSPVLLPVG